MLQIFCSTVSSLDVHLCLQIHSIIGSNSRRWSVRMAKLRNFRFCVSEAIRKSNGGKVDIAEMKMENSKILNQHTQFIRSRSPISMKDVATVSLYAVRINYMHMKKCHDAQNCHKITFVKNTFRCPMSGHLTSANRDMSQATKTEVLQKLCPLTTERRRCFWEGIFFGEHSDDGQIYNRQSENFPQ